MEIKKSYRDILCSNLEQKNNILQDTVNHDKVNHDKINHNKADNNKYRIIDVSKKTYNSVPRLDKNCTNNICIPWNYKKKEKPLLVKQFEEYNKPLTFDLMSIGNFYSVRDKPDYYGASYQNFVAQCIGKETDCNGVNWITYKMISNPDEYLECRYIVIKSNVFTNKNFKRLPEDFWINYKKYEKQICKEYYIDHVELTGIY